MSRVKVNLNLLPEQLELMWAYLENPLQAFPKELELLELEEWEWVVAELVLEDLLEEKEQSQLH
jgi:hypothetical protein